MEFLKSVFRAAFRAEKTGWMSLKDHPPRMVHALRAVTAGIARVYAVLPDVIARRRKLQILLGLRERYSSKPLFLCFLLLTFFFCAILPVWDSDIKAYCQSAPKAEYAGGENRKPKRGVGNPNQDRGGIVRVHLAPFAFACLGAGVAAGLAVSAIFHLLNIYRVCEKIKWEK